MVKNKILIQKVSLLVSDAVALFLSLVIASWLLDLIRPGNNEVSLAVFGLAKFGGVLLLAVFWYQEQYMKRRPTWEELRLLYRTIFIFALLHLVISYLLAHNVVKLLNVFFWVGLLIILPGLRYLTKNILRHLQLWQRNIYIIGTGPIALSTCELLQHNKSLGYNVVAFVEPSVDTLPAIHNSIPVLNYTTVANNKITDAEIVFAMPSAELLLHSDKIDLLQSKYLFVSIVPEVSGLPLYGVEVEHFFGSDQLFLRLQNNLGRKLNRYIKRCMDLVIGGIMLVVLLPVFITIALLIKITTRGPVFFGHQRVGMLGVAFKCLKFRTMHTNSAELLTQLLSSDANAKLEWDAMQKLRDDPRVTKIGNFLRKTSLDELPQLWNVLVGEMSLVGPRPIVKDEVCRYGSNYYYYQLVCPGITGMWQISGRSDAEYIRRVQFDVWYVKNWSLWYDWVILFKTVPVFLLRHGAY